jgi:ribosome-binding protein aMBF1 (putative translation factor)
MTPRPKRGISAAISKGRRRLAEIHEQVSQGFRPLSSLRLAAGLSQTELAVRMEMTQSSIARFEKKPGDLSFSTLQKLVVALGVDICEVIAAVDATNTAGAR